MKRLIRVPAIERTLLTLKTAWEFITAKLILWLLSALKRLPPERSTEMAERLGRKCAPLLPRYKLVKRNIAAAFPDWDAATVEKTARGAMGNVVRTFAEYVFLDDLFDFDPEKPGEGRVEVVGVDNFLALRDRDGPVIIFTGHTGNWEILPVSASTYGLEVTALFRPPNNRFLAKRLLKARRTDKGQLVPARAGAAWSLLHVLEEGGTIGLLVDQAFTKGPHIQFMGQTATANPMAAKLARQFDCPIHPARCVRLPGGRFRLELHDALPRLTDRNGALDVLATTEQINALVEGWVRENPEQWYWVHDRWKIKGPEGAKWERMKRS
ncbi:MAG: lipid A biosynthesis lauroyl acyltransferase [Pseudomonadota bacterium]